MKLIPREGDPILLSADEDNVVFGRQPSHGRRIVHPTISREHARVFRRGDGWQVADLNSSNGTFVNDRKVTLAALQHGDVLRLGEVELRIELEVEAATGGPSKSPAAATSRPTVLEADLDDGEIQLEEPPILEAPAPAARPTPLAPGEATTIAPPRPLYGGGNPMAPRTSSLSAKGEALLRDHQQRQRGDAGGSVLRQDVSQYSGIRQLALVLLVIAVCAGLFLGVMKLTEEVVPEGGVPGASTAGSTDDAGADGR